MNFILPARLTVKLMLLQEKPQGHKIHNPGVRKSLVYRVLSNTLYCNQV